MRTRILPSMLTLSLMILAACGSDSGGGALYSDPPNVKLYGIEKAKITYEYGGDASGTKTHIIANFGQYQRQDDRMEFSFQGQPRNISRLDIIADSVQYNVDLTSMTGTRSRFDTARQNNFIRSFSEEERSDVQAAYIMRGGGQKVGRDTVLGRVCDLYDVGFQGIQQSLWNGLTLRLRVRMGGQDILMTATEIDTTFTPTPDMFAPPADASIRKPEVISRFPQGHPPIDSVPPAGASQDMPAGHPPVQNDLPEGHPPVGGQ